MPTDKATPRPWKVEGDCIVTKDGDHNTGDVIAQVRFQDQKTRRANKDFIVTACNAHDALVAALDMIDQLGNVDGTYTDHELLALIDQMRQEARAALKLARGGA